MEKLLLMYKGIVAIHTNCLLYLLIFLGLFMSSLFEWLRAWGFTATSSIASFVNSLGSVPTY